VQRREVKVDELHTGLRLQLPRRRAAARAVSAAAGDGSSVPVPGLSTDRAFAGVPVEGRPLPVV